MARTATVRARMEPALKKEAEAVLETLGLSTTEAIRLFYRQLVLRKGLPFDVKIPNAETLEAMRQAQEGENLTEWTDPNALFSSARD